MLSNAQSKYIRSLSMQKYRKQYKVFVAEGDKIAKEWLRVDKPIEMVVATRDWATENERLIQKHPEAGVHIVAPHELQKLSTLSTPNQVMLTIPMPHQPTTLPKCGWCIALSQMQDPGNMGTIIRIADWFGVEAVCSEDCVDYYNPKVVQAAMGGHLRVALHTADLSSFVQATTLPTYAATLGGTDVYKVPAQKDGILLIGNESKGLSEELMSLCDTAVTIPKSGGAESLNAGVSAGILIALLKGS